MMTRKIIVALLLLLGLLAPAAVALPAEAGSSRDRSGPAQLKDITWGKSTAKDASWKNAESSPKVAARGRVCQSTPINCGNLTHAGDDGYNPGFKVRCNYGDNSTVFYIGQYQDARTYGCGDLDEVYVRPGEHYRCRGYSGSYGYYWYGWHSATGWYKIRDGEEPVCVLQLD